MAVAHCGLFKLGRVMEHRRLADMRPPGLFHRGYLLWLRQVKHPQTPPPWVAEALGGLSSTRPWHGHDTPLAKPAPPRALWLLGGCTHLYPCTHARACLYGTHVHAPHVHPQTYMCTCALPAAHIGVHA